MLPINGTGTIVLCLLFKKNTFCFFFLPTQALVAKHQSRAPKHNLYTKIRKNGKYMDGRLGVLDSNILAIFSISGLRPSAQAILLAQHGLCHFGTTYLPKNDFLVLSLAFGTMHAPCCALGPRVAALSPMRAAGRVAQQCSCSRRGPS